MPIRFPLLAAAVLAAGLHLSAVPAGAQAPSSPAPGWDATLAAARGKTVYWNAWAGDPRINDYIGWVGGQVRDRFGIDLRHVKVTDTADVVSRVLAEKAAGKDRGGSVDLVWINGENFAAMKENGLLHGPFVDRLPNAPLIDTEGKPTTTVDFTIPTDGMEAPWGMAQFVFVHDSEEVADPPRSAAALLDWTGENPGRFSYPSPPDFIGSTFLKQMLVEVTADPARLQRPADDADFDRVTAPLWSFLDRLHPNLARGGRSFPATGPALKQMLADGEVAMALSFHPGEASRDIAGGLLPSSVRTFVLDRGTIGNTHFVAIPYNANAPEAAMVVADFLLSPEAQIRKQDPAVWGDFTVLDLDRLDPEDRRRFDALPRGAATLSDEELGTPQLEPHPSWMVRIEQQWTKRYGS
ncbi:ABC transporter substrate-binding protein [Skermanella mucosa]|uniref:ABC transporter substrate-binding protein n=1 Tax=Skermanella mucosa TaxID=1789672 RepID=UPI00192CBDA1|nr:ABC transporter substrate-binding protein [Skermanella mucosa]UEM20038.1 ABC transporter substrate-binding protein [Skermanella mucosa]